MAADIDIKLRTYCATNIYSYTSGAELIPPSVAAGSSTQNQVLAAPVVGTEVPWAMTPDTANTYAAGAVVTAHEDPVIVDDSVTISDTKTSQPIFTIDVTDANTTDLVAVTSGFSVMKTAGSSLFSVVKTATGYDIRSGASLSAGSYPLTITATDRCGDTATGTITVTVTNTAPVFVPVSLLTVHPTPISDVTTTARSLYAFDVTDTNPITCTVDNTKFEIKTVGSAYELWLKAGSASTLNHDVTAVESMTITCSDRTDQITSSYKVPVLTNFAGTSGPLGDLSPVGTSVHQFTVTDQDDAISCSINAQESAKFGITKLDTATGAQRFDVMTIATLDYDSATSYTITVTCTDAINPVTSSRTINLADDKPVFSGLPATLSPARNDGFQTATLLCTFSVTDANDQSISTCLIQAPMDSFFNLVPGTAPTFAILGQSQRDVVRSVITLLVNVQCDDDRLPANTITETFTVPLLDEVL
ncbi:mucin-5AC-like [Dreissena polymorpha]|uniref:mucin-5AC-like n=1 Tax=Dreissena polymorpha TaxID=45954 RepID=UPI0022651842|nr:mucin-5AC-like [Dreissena polymorpha]